LLIDIIFVLCFPSISTSLDTTFEQGKVHTFTTCEPCTDGTFTDGNCTLDMAFKPDASDIGGTKTICVQVGLKTWVWLSLFKLVLKREFDYLSHYGRWLLCRSLIFNFWYTDTTRV